MGRSGVASLCGSRHEIAPVAPQLAHVRAWLVSWHHWSTFADRRPKRKKPAAAGAGVGRKGACVATN
jgi:hypothetical protein